MFHLLYYYHIFLSLSYLCRMQLNSLASPTMVHYVSKETIGLEGLLSAGHLSFTFFIGVPPTV